MSLKGADVSEEAINAFNDLKMGKKYKWIVFTITEDTKYITVAKTSTNDSWAQFCKEVVDTKTIMKRKGKDEVGRGVRFGVFDVAVKTKDNREQNKITFISYCPDEGAGLWAKMAHGASIEGAKRSFNGWAHYVQANQREDLQRAKVWRGVCADWDEENDPNKDDDYTDPLTPLDQL